MFECRLKIDGLHRKLSLEDGLNIKDLSEILTNLSKCLSEKSAKFILTKIVESSYMPVIETYDTESIDIFNEIHENISSGNFKELPSSYQEYAKSLNNILFKNGLYIEVSNSNNEVNTKLTAVEIDKEITYSSITTLTGRIVSLIGKNEKDPHIAFKTLRGVDYNILVSPEQEKSLKNFYKESQLRLRVKIKIDATTSAVSKTNLIDFEALGDIDFLDAIDIVKNDFGDIFININDSAQLLRNLRT
jgi:hypothetical protein